MADSSGAAGAEGRRVVIGSIALQALGSSSTLAVVVLISRSFDLDVQGRFSLLKGWTDIAATVLMAGLPQSVLHLAYREGTAIGAIHFAIRRYFVVLLGLMALGLSYAGWSGRTELAWVAVAAVGLVVHGLLRALLLRLGGVIVYALITIVPAVLVLLGVGLLGAVGEPAVEWAIAGASVLSAVAAYLAARYCGLPSAASGAQPLRGLWKINGFAFMQNVCVAAQVGVLLLVFLRVTGSDAAVGQLAFALYFQQAFSLLAGFLAPSIYDRYARSGEVGERLRADRRMIVILSGVLVVGTAIGLLVLPIVITRYFPFEYHEAVLASVLMAASGLLLLVDRVLSTILQVAGDFYELGIQALFRLFVGVLGAVLIFKVGRFTPAESAGIALCMTELAILARLGWIFRRGRPRFQKAEYLGAPR